VFFWERSGRGRGRGSAARAWLSNSGSTTAQGRLCGIFRWNDEVRLHGGVRGRPVVAGVGINGDPPEGGGAYLGPNFFFFFVGVLFFNGGDGTFFGPAVL